MDGHSVEFFSCTGDKALIGSLGGSKFLAQQLVHTVHFPHEKKKRMKCKILFSSWCGLGFGG